jgi:hypothetical protein
MSQQSSRLLDEKGQPLFEDAYTDNLIRVSFNEMLLKGATTVGDFVMAFRVNSSQSAAEKEAAVTKFARAFKASKFYCPRSIKTLDELKTTTFATPELVKAVEEGQASDRAKKRKEAKKKSAANPYKQKIAASKAKALEDLAKMQQGK